MVYDDLLRRRLMDNLARFEVRSHPLEGRRHAAVGILILDSDPHLHGDDPTMGERAELLANVPGTHGPDITGKVDGTAGGAAVLLTRRGSHLDAHARQWALPGGRIDQGETALEAAIREIDEEVGLTVTGDHLLGRLDDYPTRSGYVISPFVFWAGIEAEPVANPDEVASLHRIALSSWPGPTPPGS